MYRFSQFISFWVDNFLNVKVSTKVITFTNFEKKESIKVFLVLSSFFNKNFNIEELKNKFPSELKYNVLIKFFIENSIIIWLSKTYCELKQLSYFTHNPQKNLLSLSSMEVLHLLSEEHSFHNKNVAFSPTSNIWKILLQRKSERNFNDLSVPIEKEILKEILFCAYWNIRNEKGIIHRTTPSAWGFYNIIIHYFDIISWELFFYDGFELQKIWKEPKYIKFLVDSLQKTFIKNPLWIFFISWNLERSSKKYWLRSYNFSLLEAWHISQNINLVSFELWYCTCEFSWIIEEAIEKILWIWRNIYFHSIVIWKK